MTTSNRSDQTKEPGRGPLETFWQMRGSSGQVFACAMYRSDAGLELHVGFDHDDPISVVAINDVEEARARAAKLKGIVLEKGGFTEVASM